MGFILSSKGRYNRSQWWITQIAIGSIFTAAMYLLAGTIDIDALEQQTLSGSAIASLLVIFGILAWVNVAASIKRYHDRNKSGWWFLIFLVPVVGPLWQLVELGFFTGDDDDNGYDPDGQIPRGPSPRGKLPTATVIPATVVKPGNGQKPSFGRRN